MKGLLIAALLGCASSANATQPGYYYFSFFPDNPSEDGFSLCSYVANQGPKPPFPEIGLITADSVGPYGSPAGQYNETQQDVEGRNSLAIFMSTSGINGIPQYQYFLNGDNASRNFPFTRNGRYMIALSSQPPALQRGDARPRTKPGGYVIVDTGSFKIQYADGGCN